MNTKWYLSIVHCTQNRTRLISQHGNCPPVDNGTLVQTHAQCGVVDSQTEAAASLRTDEELLADQVR